MTNQTDGPGHRFGGDWTTDKLKVLAGYLQSYTTALKHQKFAKVYIDAFAGSGYREARSTARVDRTSSLLFPDLAAQEPQALLDGSARLALQVRPRFERYLFVDSSEARCAHLQSLKAEFPALAPGIDVRRGEANIEIQALCRAPWRSERAVLFLDPYGMQVDWETIEAVARTKAIDTWLLFPVGIGVNRLLTRSGEIPDAWRHRLDTLLGTKDWFDEFYKVRKRSTLFGETEETVKLATTETIGRYFVSRLAKVFAAVAHEPRVLANSANSPLYLLCFAAGNTKGAPIALSIANHLLKKGTE